MALRNVQPGELITSADWNELVDALGGLDTRVSNLENGSASVAPRITQVFPTGARTAGDTIRIYGSNFGFTIGGHSVTFGNTQAVSFLTGSSDSLLIVKIPDEVDGATSAGVPITMTVSNLHSFATWVLTIKSQPVASTDSIILTHLSTQPTTPTVGQPLRFTFEMVSQTQADTTVTIIPTTQRQLGGSLVDDSTIMVIVNNQPVANRQIPLPEGATINLEIRIPTIPDSPGTQFALTVFANAPGLTAVSTLVPNLVIGQPSAQPDTTVTSWQRSAQGIVNGNVTFVSLNDGIVSGQFDIARTNTSAVARLTIELDATFANIPVGPPYTYSLEESLAPAVSGWSVARSGDTPAEYSISASDSDPDSEEFPAWVVTTGTTVGESVVTLGVHRSVGANTVRREVKYRVRVTQ